LGFKTVTVIQINHSDAQHLKQCNVQFSLLLSIKLKCHSAMLEQA